jgi:hypothetical protein
MTRWEGGVSGTVDGVPLNNPPGNPGGAGAGGIGKAQQPAGYLSTRIILEKLERFQDIHHHELYNMGHLMTAACIHHRATGKTNFLDLAKKMGDSCAV